jgi:hypothetical protein
MQICPDCGLRIDDDDLNETQPGCRFDREEESEFDYEGMLADGEAFLRAAPFTPSAQANTLVSSVSLMAQADQLCSSGGSVV